ncbi:toluene tolerance protein [Candidatus Nitrosoglobus terrae]|uniref:Toluene tolerance protein n=1 Tax=Candidatus Nitrosoglobus terrae TaxID=1630141 RepID=A0A1Q2SPC8_9GAMM|nr:ABC transporter substrate-binding protein [Candidatus Nitrosoglobus terrae]BAW80982.1 toluene tolerance protein [Candidatus Nitrosoglobus terrae]
MSVSADGLSTASAQDLVRQTSDRLLKTVKAHQKELDDHPDRIYSIVENIVVPHFDFWRVAQLALGKYWRQATLEQRQRFTNEFRVLIVRTYSVALLKYSEQKVHYLPIRGSAEANDTIVRLEIQPGEGSPSILMNVHLYNKNGSWKIFNVAVDGVSLVTNYRADFASQIRNGGLDQLIEKLAEKNKKAGA